MDRAILADLIAKTWTSPKDKKITFLTGAGISAESGIPTYRGTDGIWVKGSQNYRPEEFGTFRFFQENPRIVWQFALYRKWLFKQVKPNPGHIAIAYIEQLLQDRFHLITQNIDQLHFRAGNSKTRTYEIHGNLEYIRCSRECTKMVYPFPEEVTFKSSEEEMSEEEWQKLKCPNCGSITRPNILWFDERYNERLFKLDSSLKVAKNTGLMFIVGTSGATNLPNQLVAQTLRYGGAIIDINIEEGHFAEVAKEKKKRIRHERYQQ